MKRFCELAQPVVVNNVVLMFVMKAGERDVNRADAFPSPVRTSALCRHNITMGINSSIYLL